MAEKFMKLFTIIQPLTFAFNMEASMDEVDGVKGDEAQSRIINIMTKVSTSFKRYWDKHCEQKLTKDGDVHKDPKMKSREFIIAFLSKIIEDNV